MKQALLIAVLLFSVMSSGAQSAGHAYYGPTYVFEILNPIVTNDTTTVRLKIAVRECVDEIEIKYVDWQDNLAVLRRDVRGSDTSAFDLHIGIPIRGDLPLEINGYELVHPKDSLCIRTEPDSVVNQEDSVRTQSVAPGDYFFHPEILLERIGDSLKAKVIELVPVDYGTDEKTRKSRGNPDILESARRLGRPHVVEAPYAHSIPDTQQVVLKGTGPETSFVPRSEWTEEEKHRIDSLTGSLPWQRERARKAKLEETPLTCVNYRRLKGVGADKRAGAEPGLLFARFRHTPRHTLRGRSFSNGRGYS